MASEKYDMGTPIKGERVFTERLRDVRQRLFSPGQHMDAVDAPDVPAPVTPAAAQPCATMMQAPPAVTLEAIASLLDKKFDEKLGPVTEKVNELKEDMQDIKEQQKMTERNVENLSNHMDAMKNELEGRMTTLEAKVAQCPGGVGDAPDRMRVKMVALEERINSLKLQTPQEDDRALTAVVGGLSGFGSEDDAKEFLKAKIWDAWLPSPEEMYHKGDFKGMLWCKFANETDRNKMIKHFGQAAFKVEGKRVWSKPDLPLDQRLPIEILFAVKKMMVGWEWAKEALWVDEAERQLTIGGNELVLEVSILNKSSNFNFGEGWGEHLRCDELEKIMKDADAKLLSAGAKPSKGLGKGKPKGKHHE